MCSGLKNKFRALLNKLKLYEFAVVAFSGGVDSTFLAKASVNALGENTLAITVML